MSRYRLSKEKKMTLSIISQNCAGAFHMTWSTL